MRFFAIVLALASARRIDNTHAQNASGSELVACCEVEGTCYARGKTKDGCPEGMHSDSCDCWNGYKRITYRCSEDKKKPEVCCCSNNAKFVMKKNDIGLDTECPTVKFEKKHVIQNGKWYNPFAAIHGNSRPTGARSKHCTYSKDTSVKSYGREPTATDYAKYYGSKAVKSVSKHAPRLMTYEGKTYKTKSNGYVQATGFHWYTNAGLEKEYS